MRGAPMTDTERRRLAGKISGTVHDPLPVNRPTPVFRFPAPAVDRRPPALSRGPCPYCETRGDLGCAHQRPYEPAPPPPSHMIEVEPARRIVATSPKAFSAKDDALIIMMLEAGASMREIARAADRKVGSIYSRLRVLVSHGRLDPSVLPGNKRRASEEQPDLPTLHPHFESEEP